MNEIKVTCCDCCPFVFYYHNSYLCGHPDIVIIQKLIVSEDGHEGFPSNTQVHSQCPLKKESITISLWSNKDENDAVEK